MRIQLGERTFEVSRDDPLRAFIAMHSEGALYVVITWRKAGKTLHYDRTGLGRSSQRRPRASPDGPIDERKTIAGRVQKSLYNTSTAS